MTGNAVDHAREIAALSARLADAQAACAAKDNFIAAISRELNNPLAPVLLAVEHLRAVLPEGEAARITAAMRLLERATDGFARRTQMLLDLADLTSGAIPLVLKPLDVSELLSDVAASHAATARLAGCTLAVELAPGLVAMADAKALRQVMIQLLANAFRFGAGRPVRVIARRTQDGQAAITVADQGPGIEAEKAEHLFALFEQTRPPLEPGLGIGLWVAAQLVAAMGGTIAAESPPGGGAQFNVRLARGQDGATAGDTQTLQSRGDTGIS
jgi:signal transduction histidine kinase